MSDSQQHSPVRSAEDNFTPGRPQDAYFTIRGFVHQVDATVAAWLQLGSDEKLELERGEDIDLLTSAGELRWADTIAESSDQIAFDRLLTQVKHLQRPITLRTPAVREAIANFAVHRYANPQSLRQLRFRFSTTADVTRESPNLLAALNIHPSRLLDSGLPVNLPGIKLWQQVAEGSLTPEVRAWALQAIRTGLRTFDSSGVETTPTALVGELQKSDDELVDFIQRFEFGTEMVSGRVARKHLERCLVDAGLAQPQEAARIYEHLFETVFRRLSKEGLKTLTRDELIQEIEAAHLRPADSAQRPLAQTLSQVLDHLFADQLAAMGRNWQAGEFKAVDDLLKPWLQPATLDLLSASQRAEVHEWASRLELYLQRDLTQAAMHMDALDRSGGDASILRLYLAREDSDGMTALLALQSRTDLPARHARIAHALPDDLDVAEAELAAVGEEAGAETWRLRALVALGRNAVDEARQHIDRALLAPDADEMTRCTAAMVQYHEAHVVWDASRLQVEPLPAQQLFLRQDPASVTGLQDAARTFGRAAHQSQGAGGLRKAAYWFHWQLACLAECLADPEPAAALASARLLVDPEDPFILLWVFCRSLNVDLTDLRSELTARVAERKEPATLGALLYAYLAQGDDEAAQALQTDHPDVFVTPQINGGATSDVLASTSSLVGEELLDPRQTWEEIEAFEALAFAGRWTDVASRAAWFVKVVPTFEGLRLASTCAYNAGAYATARDLLLRHADLCPGGRLSADLQHILIEALAATGELTSAIEEAEKLLVHATNIDRELLYTRLLFALGDDARLEITARRLLQDPTVPLRFLLSLAEHLIETRPELARTLWETVDRLGIPDDLISSAIQVAIQLDPQPDISTLLNRAWLVGPEQSGVMSGTFDSFDNQREAGGAGEAELRMLMREQQVNEQQLWNAYVRGELPIHHVAGPALPPQLLKLLIDQESGDQPGSFLMLGRSTTPVLQPSETPELLSMDLCAYLIAGHFNLLDRLEQHFGFIQVSPYLLPALTHGIIHARPVVSDDLLRRIQAARSRLKVIPRDAVTQPALDSLGGGWSQLEPFATARGIIVVDELPERLHSLATQRGSHAPEFEHLQAVVPELLLTSLVQHGLIDHVDAEVARPHLWTASGTAGSPPTPGCPIALTWEAVKRLARAGLLRLVAQHFETYVLESDLDILDGETKDLQTRNDVLLWLRQIRRRLSEGLRDGRYRVLPTPHPWTAQDGPPLLNDLGFLRHYAAQPTEVLWIEDRWVHLEAQRAGQRLWALVDVLAMLRSLGQVSPDEHRNLLARARRAGLGLIPTSADELNDLVAPSFQGLRGPQPALNAWVKYVRNLLEVHPTLQPQEQLHLQEIRGLIAHVRRQVQEGELAERAQRVTEWFDQSLPPRTRDESRD